MRQLRSGRVGGTRREDQDDGGHDTRPERDAAELERANQPAHAHPGFERRPLELDEGQWILTTLRSVHRALSANWTGMREHGDAHMGPGDATSEAIRKTLTRAHELDPENHQIVPTFGTVLSKANFLMLSNYEKVKRRGTSNGLEAGGAIPAPEGGEDAQTAATQIDDAAAYDKVIQTAATLPPEFREVFVLVVRGMPYAEAAMTLDVPVGTVKSRYSRAIRRLRKQLESGSQSD